MKECIALHAMYCETKKGRDSVCCLKYPLNLPKHSNKKIQDKYTDK